MEEMAINTLENFYLLKTLYAALFCYHVRWWPRDMAKPWQTAFVLAPAVEHESGTSLIAAKKRFLAIWLVFERISDEPQFHYSVAMASAETYDVVLEK